MSKYAVVMFNLGGPDNLKAVKPFLFNLFHDPAIIRLPQPFRWMLAKWISFKRDRKAQGIYQEMGGKSPILEQTLQQAQALEMMLKQKSEDEYKTFVSMRYWHPMSQTVAKNIKQYQPDHIILLPLYPQFSTTTTASSFADWQQAAEAIGLDVPTTRICCYPTERSFIAAHVKLIKDSYWKAAEFGKPRLLFSAHGLPKKVIAAGDPYQWQVEKTVEQVCQILTIDKLDYRISYQSRVGPLEWIGPSTEDEIMRAGEDKVPLVVIPIAFVSEHSETLVELDIEYRQLAQRNGVPSYQRVRALSVEPHFIEALANLCLASGKDTALCSFQITRYCPKNLSACAHNIMEKAA
ncbi:MAG: ferrochelatase [Rickettsiales bacterium]|nr:ferrochelatase [Rickettsiales bacterium]